MQTNGKNKIKLTLSFIIAEFMAAVKSMARISENISILKSEDGQNLTPLAPPPLNFFNVHAEENNVKDVH